MTTNVKVLKNLVALKNARLEQDKADEEAIAKRCQEYDELAIAAGLRKPGWRIQNMFRVRGAANAIGHSIDVDLGREWPSKLKEMGLDGCSYEHIILEFASYYSRHRHDFGRDVIAVAQARLVYA